MPFEFKELEIKGVLSITPRVFPDPRGFLMETYKLSEFGKNGICKTFVQDIYTRSSRNVIRGLHFQIAPKTQAKLVHVVQGAIYDIAVDIRHGSETFGKWVGQILSEENKQMLYIPSGFAHGFCTLSDTADIHYKVDQEYSPNEERGIRWDDPVLQINWPIQNPVLSDKDAHLPSLKEILEQQL